jgi:pilus assembly protein CpaD
MLTKPAFLSSKASRLRVLALTGATAALLAGCQTDDAITGSIAPDDYHNRHPIVLTDSPTSIDIFPGGQGALDSQSVAEIRAFASRYREYGESRIVIFAPNRGGPKIHAGVDAIRRTLASAGLRGSVGLGFYPVADPMLASPIRLSYRGLKAEVPSRCGQWPTDLASGSSLGGWKNENYWNFGCATQSMLAAEVDDPRDFVRARALGPSDVQMRMRAIGDVRTGNDPGTAWAVQTTNIGQVGN